VEASCCPGGPEIRRLAVRALASLAWNGCVERRALAWEFRREWQAIMAAASTSTWTATRLPAAQAAVKVAIGRPEGGGWEPQPRACAPVHLTVRAADAVTRCLAAEGKEDMQGKSRSSSIAADANSSGGRKSSTADNDADCHASGNGINNGDGDDDEDG
ncbi:unnamed protein product, partial [Phaeothamnion confervicola]